MKKIIAMILCVLTIISLVGCNAKEKRVKTTIQIGDIIYYNTGDTVPVEPDASAIVDAHPSEGDEIEAYAIINPDDVDEMLVGLIDGEWYKFIAE